MAPATVLITGGSFRSGLFSLKWGEAMGTPPISVRPCGLIKDGLRAASALPTRGRKPTESRALSMDDPPETPSAPARTAGSTLRNIVP